MLALDLGATQMRACLVDSAGAVSHRRDRPTKPDRGPDAVRADAIELLRSVLDELTPERRRDLVGVGVSAPGPLDPSTGVLIEPPNMGLGFRDQPLGEPVSAALRLPVVVERDTHVAALGEQAFGAGRGVSDFVYLTLSTGVGGAIVTDGRLLTGPDGVAGEIGHLPVLLDGPLCGCGARGHLEALASGVGIARAGREAALDGSSPALARRSREVGPETIDARAVAEAAAAGDEQAGRIMDRARQAFGAAAVGLVNVLNPERIIVGGGIAETHGADWLAYARAEVERLAFRIPGARVRIVPAELGADVSLVGAAPLVAQSGRGRTPRALSALLATT